jgi:formylglycine-generating enzyme required for sulfatase activity
MPVTYRIGLGPVLVLACAAWLAGCDECETSRDCGTGEACIDGTCEKAEPFDPGSDTDVDIDSDSDADTDTEDPYPLEWIEIPGGSFSMGYEDGLPEELPVHTVTVPTFEMTRSEIMCVQYSKCVAAGECAVPETGVRFNWQVAGRFTYPINGVTWIDASAFCAWAGGRLPSEAEWEYAARSGGQSLVYPWGSATPSCDYCIMRQEEDTIGGCGENLSWPVCSKPDGNTEQGLCDMSGNVYEWMADYWYPEYYEGVAPTDGSAWDTPPYEGAVDRTLRGGSYQTNAYTSFLRTTGRLAYAETGCEPDLGFRCARDVQ